MSESTEDRPLTARQYQYLLDLCEKKLTNAIQRIKEFKTTNDILNNNASDLIEVNKQLEAANAKLREAVEWWQEVDNLYRDISQDLMKMGIPVDKRIRLGKCVADSAVILIQAGEDLKQVLGIR